MLSKLFKKETNTEDRALRECTVTKDTKEEELTRLIKERTERARAYLDAITRF